MSSSHSSAVATGGMPDRVLTRLGALEFTDGAPNQDTVLKIYDNLDFHHAVSAFLNTFQGASTHAIRKAFHGIGIKDNAVMLFSELMDAKSVFLTPNADTIYFWSFIDLSKCPMVVETPPMALGTFDDMWFQWISDFGLPGPDRGAGGKYLLVPEDYHGVLPDGGFHVFTAHTKRVQLIGRSFLVDNDPKPAVETIRNTLKIYPYAPGGFGTSIGTLLKGNIPLSPPPPVPATTFVEGTGTVINTIPPSDFAYFELIHDFVQDEVGTDPEIMGQLAAIGIRKGQPFHPGARMKRLLADAAAIGSATGRALNFAFRDDEAFAYYPESGWMNGLWAGGYTFETPPPLVTPEGVKPFPPTGARTLNARTWFFYLATGVTPAMSMRLTGVGSQYLVSYSDTAQQYFNGGRIYQVTLPRDIPEERFWSLTVYDNQTRSMLDTPQRYPRAGSQTYPSPAAEPNADGSTTVYFAPEQPEGVQRGNWIQTMPGKGWFTILRLYSPRQAYFDKTWRIGEIEMVK